MNEAVHVSVNENHTPGVVVRVPDFEIARGEDGLSAYEQAVLGGYTGTEAQFNEELSSFKTLHDETVTNATAAAASATGAGQSATAAAGSAENAASSATASASSAYGAYVSAGSASDSAASAASSAATAAASAVSAGNSASTATEKASEATSSATAASTSATAAAGSASNAASSATAASASATAAGAAQTAAETAASHYPQVTNGYWYVWDVSTGAYVNTNVKAEGEDGAPGRDGAPGQPGRDGQDGAPGVTYAPTVSADGEISWTNDGGLPNPTPRNITGPQGAPGEVTQAEFDELKGAIENSIGTTDTPIPTTETLDCIIKSRWNGSATPSSANGRARSPRIEYVSGMLSITLKSTDVLFMPIWGSNDGETLTLWNDVSGGRVRDISTFPYHYLYFDIKREDNQAFPDDFPTNIIEITSEGSSVEKQLNTVKDLIIGHGGYCIIAGCIRRQSQSDNWNFIVDQNHQCDLNCSSVSVNDRGNIVLNYPDLNTKKVIFASVFPDETFASQGISCGSSVGKELTNIYVYKTIPYSGIAEVSMLGIAATLITSQGHILSTNWDSASSTLNINHDIPGSFHALSINITQTGTGELAIPRVVRNVSGAIGIQFYDISGNLITNFTNTTQFTISIVNTREMERVYTNGNDLYSAEGNFWFFGIFEVF